MNNFNSNFDNFIAEIIGTHLDIWGNDEKSKVLYIGSKQKNLTKQSLFFPSRLNLKKSVKLANKKVWISDSYSKNNSSRNEQLKKMDISIGELKKTKQKFEIILLKGHMATSLISRTLPTFLVPGGICLIVHGPTSNRMIRHRFATSDRFVDKWKSKGLYHQALFAFSNASTYKDRRTGYTLEIIQKKKNKELFVVSNDELLDWPSPQIKGYLDSIFDNYFEGSPIDDGSPLFGTRYNLNKFKGITWIENEFKENEIQTDIKQFDRHLLGKLIKNIKRIDTHDLEEYEFIEASNNLCIIQTHKSIDIISRSKNIDLTKWDRLFIIELEDIILKDYLEIYFHSVIGKMYRSEVETMEDLTKIPIYLPNKTIQKKRIKTGFSVLEKMAELKNVLEDLLAQFASSPSSSEEILKKIEGMIQETKVLTKAEEIQRLIDAQMETKITEFKDGYHFNYKVPEDIAKRNKLIEEEKMRSLDEINAFLNTDGGHLIFGVLDEKNTKSKKFEVIGISKDLKKYKSNDELKTSIINSMRDNFREVVADYINFHFIKLEDKDLLVIEIESYRARNQNYVFWKDQNKQVKYRSSSSSLDLPIPEMDTFKMSGKIENR